MTGVRDATQALIIAPPAPSKFTLSQWHLNNNHRYRTSEDQQQIAERVIRECDRFLPLIEDITKRNKTESDKKLEARIKHIGHLKEENEMQKAECCLEEEALLVYKERIMDALQSIKANAVQICQKCLILREGRLGIDLAHDNVERELHKEAETISGAQALLTRALEQTHEQIRLLRSTKYFLDRDNEDKSNALKIDDYCLSLQETSLNLSMYHGRAPLDCGNVTAEEWERFSEEFIQKAAKEINNARPLRSYIDTLLIQVVDDLRKQQNKTNNAFRDTIAATRAAKTRLEQEHHETVRLANEMTRAITRLEISIAEKEGYLALAHTRLGNRAQRPAIELTKDEVESRLVAEVMETQANIASLQEMMAEAQASLRYLLKNQIQLEEDINIKANTLKIDEVDCMTLRESMSFHSY